MELLRAIVLDHLPWLKAKSGKLSKVARLTRVYLSVMATSAPSERNYSLAAQGASQRRAALSTSSVNDILLINSTRTRLN